MPENSTRLDESLSKDTFTKSLTGELKVKIDPSKITISGTGSVVSADNSSNGSSSSSNSSGSSDKPDGD